MLRKSTINSLIVAAAAGLAGLAGTAAAAPVVTVIPASAPNSFGSPNFSGWVANAQAALQSGASSAGTPGTPAYYQAAPAVIDATDNIATSFNSWKGVAPAPGVGFGSELGNRLHFGVRVVDTTATFSLSQLQYDMSSSDPGNFLNFDGSFTAGDSYSATRVGIHYGADQAPGGGDDTVYTSGSATTPVNALFYVGIGNAPSATAGSPGATNQDKIDNALAGLDYPYTISTTYTIAGETGSASVTVVPEPVNAALLALGACLMVARRRR